MSVSASLMLLGGLRMAGIVMPDGLMSVVTKTMAVVDDDGAALLPGRSHLAYLGAGVNTGVDAGWGVMNYPPKSQLIARQYGASRPSRPVIDARNHLGPFGGGWDQCAATAWFARLDQAGVVHCADLDGGWGEAVLHHRLTHFKAFAPDRCRGYGRVNWGLWQQQDRIPFGIDAGPDLDTCATDARFPECEDDYFRYNPDGIPGQGRWMIYGLNLPQDILAKV